MGLLVEGRWQDQWYESSEGRRVSNVNRHSGATGSTADGQPGPSGRRRL